MPFNIGLNSLDQLAKKAFQPVQYAIELGRIPGAVLGIVDNNGARAVVCAGKAQLTPVERDMSNDTWFDLASLSKVIFTTNRVIEHVLAGRIDLDAPLTILLPDLRQYDADAWERRVTFRECLGHQTPFPAVEPIYTYGDDPELLRAFVLQRAWRRGPAAYSDINFMLLGFALERLEGKYIREMDVPEGFAFQAPPEQSAATEHCTWRKKIMCGEVHDENCYALQGAGHAGLFGPAEAVLNFMENLLRNPDSEKVKLMRQPLSETRSHGFEHKHMGWSGGDNCSKNTIGHTGFTGTGLWIDFEKLIGWTLLSNRIHPTRHFDSGITALRRTVGDLVAQG